MQQLTHQGFTCSGCGTPSSELLPFRCPRAETFPAFDHVLHRDLELGSRQRERAVRAFGETEENPFIRFRLLSAAYHLAMTRGWSDDRYVDLVGRLDREVEAIAGIGFRTTPLVLSAELSTSLGCNVWVKDETVNVAGTHKGRHLMGVMLWLWGLREEKLVSLDDHPLAIASCGNAALAAAVVGAAGGSKLDVFIPEHASSSMVSRLTDLGARLHRCRRAATQPGDPCVARFRAAVDDGALPFTCQGSENALAVDGGETLAYELVSSLRTRHQELDRIVIQVGGGALASSVVQGLELCRDLDVLANLPRVCTVQTTGCYPLHRAWRRIADEIGEHQPLGNDEADAALIQQRMSPEEIDEAIHRFARQRSHYMWPWDTEPKSIADGILDDETYDWLAITRGMMKTGGYPTVVDEEEVGRANRLGRQATGILVGNTGSAGLAGCLRLSAEGRLRAGEQVGILFTGIERDRPS